MKHSISIILKEVSVRFNKEWVFKNVNLQIESKSKTVILGGNGSGKSTLLQLISTYLMPENGTVTYGMGDRIIPEDEVHQLISLASPFISLTEEFTLSELIHHTKLFKPLINNYSEEDVLDLLELRNAALKPIKHFSSGMKQRVKLGLAILADAPVLLLDEPLTNLDSNGIEWYKKLIKEHTAEKTILVCSNTILDEYTYCTQEININDYK